MKVFTWMGPTLAAALVTWAPTAHADDLGYLVNTMVRPGYTFGNADEALAYGRGICDKIAGGARYAEVASDVKTDLNTSDEFQASYLISQSAEMLCPQLIWQLRNSAAHYVPPPK